MASRPPTDPAIRCLDEVAREAAARLQGEAVVRIAPRDSALTWKAASVHPLQALETEYQGIVEDAVRSVDDPDTRKRLESEALGDFFFFDAAPPRLLGVGLGEPYAGMPFPLLEDRLRAARRQIKAAGKLMAAAPQQPVDRAELRACLNAACQELLSVRDAFLTLDGSAAWRVPTIEAASRALASVPLAIQGQLRRDSREAIYSHLKMASAELELAVLGLASIQMFYVIRPFYLFRLLVRFRVESEQPLRPDAITDASSKLTDLVTNGHPWLSVWLREKIVDLAGRLAATDPSGNTLFFLKGGRAILYMMGTPDQGTNDWDTQILINPLLPAADWYALFLRVSNAVLLALQAYKAEFYMLLHRHARDFQRELKTVATLPLPMERPDPSPDRDEAERLEKAVDEAAPEATGRTWGNCKAELIDVGLPRYDTVEAREQWHQLGPDALAAATDGGAPPPIIVAPDGIPYPGPLYYIVEYVQIIRETFAGLSTSPGKTPTRIKRLYAILQLAGVAPVIAAQREEIPPARLPHSLALVDAIANTPTRSALIVLLRQFAEAYDLAHDPGLAAAFDRFFADQLPNARQRAPYPRELIAAIQKEAGAGKWDDDFTHLATAIGFAQWVSQEMTEHFTARDAFMTGKSKVLDDFLDALFAATIFSPNEELEVQLALRSSFAARLQAEYSSYAHTAALDPVTSLSLGLYSPREDADPPTLIELVRPAVNAFLQDNPNVFTMVKTADAIRLYWAADQPIAPFTYRPLAIEILVNPLPDRPLLSYLWGQATLGLRDLVREYRAGAAAIEEYGRRTVLLRTAAALTEIMTQAANPEPVNPAIAALRKGDCHHLMISSASNAIDRAAAYPQGYYQAQGPLPYMAFEVTMTDNRPALRSTLTLASAPVNRTLDLLAVTHGDGGMNKFAGWTSAELRTFLVRPLLDSGVSANNIILDFPLSASLIDVFAPLCTATGGVYSFLYRVPQLIVTTEFWEIAQPALARRDLNALQQAIIDRMKTISTALDPLAGIPPNCPTPLTFFAAANRVLTLDAALAGPEIASPIKTLLQSIAPGAPSDALAILGELERAQTISATYPVSDFMQ